MWVGLNLLPLSALQAFEELPQELYNYIKAIWADDANISESQSAAEQPYPSRVRALIHRRKFPGLYFGGVSFKYQRRLSNLAGGSAAKIAREYMNVITTSGSATGVPPEVEKIVAMKIAAGKTPIAIASGISAENVSQFTNYVDCFLVASSISESFHELSLPKMKELVEKIHSVSKAPLAQIVS